ncbi:MAG: hypothetical protein ACFFH0_01035 [Promethearchaeota archaeon]
MMKRAVWILFDALSSLLKIDPPHLNGRRAQKTVSSNAEFRCDSPRRHDNYLNAGKRVTCFRICGLKSIKCHLVSVTSDAKSSAIFSFHLQRRIFWAGSLGTAHVFTGIAISDLDGILNDEAFLLWYVDLQLPLD